MPIRILYVHNSADLYGASRSLLRLLAKLDRQQFTPFAVLPEDGPLRTRLEEIGIKVLLEPRLSIITRSVFRSWSLLRFLIEFPGSVARVKRIIRQNQIQLVHTNTGVILAPALAARLAGVVHVWHIRDWFQEFKALWRPYAAYINVFADRILTVSEAVAGQFPDRRKVVVVHNGFSLSEFNVPKAELRREFRARFQCEDRFVAGCVGRIKFVRKGQEVLVHAIALLKQRGRPIQGLIVGSVFPGNESHLKDLRKLSADLGIQDDLIFTGELDDTRPAYAAMDVCILPSGQPEPFGGVVMEAMAMGVPVIATAIGGSVDQIADGETGLLIPPGDAAALAAKLELLINDPSLRSRMSVAGPKRVEEHFSIDRMVKRIEDIYRELAAR
jgi:glycosyltransferase involved in cell wall biosynthesis